MMHQYQTSKLPLSVPFLFVSLIIGIVTNAQVIAGIKANGIEMKNGDTVNVCRGGSVLFQSTAQGSLNITWNFFRGVPNTRSGIGPFNINYYNTGIDTAYQYVGTGVFRDSMFVIVNVTDLKPKASFDFSPDNVCGNEFIQFTNTSSVGDPLKYSWNFSDGIKSTEKDPSHQFLTAVGLPGTQPFPVKLVVTNQNACVDSITKVVTIRKVPDAAVGNADPTVIFAPFNGVPTFKKCNNIPSYYFTFLNESTTQTNNASYHIEWGDGSPDTTFTSWPAGAAIGHTFPIGSNLMKVSVTGQDGCVGIKEYIVFLGTVPAGGLASLGNTDICSSDSLRFAITNINNNPPGTTYSFYINDGSGTLVYKQPPPGIVAHYFNNGSCSFSSNNGQQTYINAFGAYLTIENPCGSNSASVVPIYVSGKPRPRISTPSPVVCVNTTVAIQNASIFGNVITPTGGFSSVCENTGKRVWGIMPSTGYTLVSGTLGSLNGNVHNGANWTDGSDLLNVQFTQTGIYTIKIYIYNPRCGIDSAFSTICVRTLPQASFTMSQKTSCGPVTVDMNNTSPGGGCQGDEYRWTITYSDPSGCAPEGGTAYAFANGTGLTSASPSLRFNKIGRYIVRLSVRGISSSCPPGVATDTFFVKGPPRADIPAISSICASNSINPSVIINSCYSKGPFGYQWQFDNALPASSTDSLPGSITYATEGTHPVQLIVTDSSCNLSDTINTTVNIVPLPSVLVGNDTTVCSNQPVPLGKAPGTQGNFSYSWSPAAGLDDPAIPNPTTTLSYTGPQNDTTYTYYVTASLGANCSVTDSVKVTVLRSPVISITPESVVICIGSSIELVASGADEYTWSPAISLSSSNTGTVIASPDATTTYLVEGLLANGCGSRQTVNVAVVPDPKAEFLAPDTNACSPVNLNKLITPVPYPESNHVYNWYANDVLIGTNSTGEVPSHVLDTPGMSVVIKLITLSNAGCKADSMQKTFTTVPTVTASFTKDKFSSCSPLEVLFTNTSSSLVNTNFTWDFGNGATSNDAQPGLVVFRAGPFFRDTVYKVVLKASNGCIASTFTDSVKVFADPKAKFAVDTTRGCSPFTFTIINTSLGNNDAYYWDFGDGQTDTTHSLGSFSHTYYTGSITTFTIRLIAENQCSRDTQMLNIVVSPNEIKPFVAANGDQLRGCAPHSVTFTNSTIGASVVTWNFGDNTGDVITPNSQGSITHRYASAGNYNVIIRLRNDCSDTTISRTVQVFDPPLADFDALPSRLCTGQAVTLINRSQNANAYAWDWDDGSNSSLSNGKHIYAQAGTYDIVLVVQRVHSSGFVCSDTATRQVTVLDKIPASIGVAPGKPCVPYNLNVEALNAIGASRVEWTVYDSSTVEKEFKLDGNTVSHVYDVPGSYSVRLVVHTTSGCTDTATYRFTVYPSPRTVFDPNQISTCRHDTTIQFTAVTTHAGNEPVNYKWFINDQIEGTANPFTYRFQAPLDNSTPTEFIIKALAQTPAGCGDTSLAGKVVIQPLPAPIIQVNPSLVLRQPDYQFTFKDLAHASLQKNHLWEMGDPSRQTRTGREITYVYGDTGTYKVMLHVSDFSTGCKATDSVQVTVLYVPGYLQVPNAMCLGCSNYSLRQFLPLGKGLKQYRLRIYTTWGQKIFETTSLNADGSPNVAWDGTFNGKAIQQDAYGWEIEATYQNGTEWKGMIYPGSSRPVKAGFITIIK